MSFGGLLQWVSAVYLDLHLITGDQIEQLRSILFQILTFGHVAVDDRPHQFDIFSTKLQNVDGRHGTGLTNVGKEYIFYSRQSIGFSSFGVSYSSI